MTEELNNKCERAYVELQYARAYRQAVLDVLNAGIEETIKEADKKLLLKQEAYNTALRNMSRSLFPVAAGGA